MKKLFNANRGTCIIGNSTCNCIVVCIALALIILISSCSTLKPYGKYQKRWAYLHPYAAIKLKKEKSRCDIIYNAVKDANSLDSYENGGKLDAFRHLFYMAAFSSKVASPKVKKLGIAHEKDNYQMFLKGKNEEGEKPDSLSCEMDLLNNAIGIELGQSLKRGTSLVEIRTLCMSKIDAGNAYFMKRDSLGNYLTCDGKKIDMSIYRQVWNIPKCLVRQ